MELEFHFDLCNKSADVVEADRSYASDLFRDWF